MKTVAAQPILFPNAADQRSGASTDISSILPGFSAQNALEAKKDTFIAPKRCLLRPIQRLVVLVPEGGLDENALARRVWGLASASALDVLFLGLSPDQQGAAHVRRRLALLAAAVHQGDVDARASVVIGVNWFQAVKEVLRNGDLLVSVAGHTVAYRLIWRRRLGESLAAAFRAPVYLLGGLQVGRSPAFMGRLRAMLAWSLTIVILLAFAGLQIWLSQNADIRFSALLLGLSIILEGITLLITIEWMG